MQISRKFADFDVVMFSATSCHAMTVFHLLQQVAERFSCSRVDLIAQAGINSAYIKRKAFKKKLKHHECQGGMNKYQLLSRYIFNKVY
jgi:hypothetical protein